MPATAARTPRLSLLETQVLLVLARGDMHGYGIALEIQRRDPNGPKIYPTNLYRRLHDLADRGLIDQTDTELDDKGRARKLFAITLPGREALGAETNALAHFVDELRTVGGLVGVNGDNPATRFPRQAALYRRALGLLPDPLVHEFGDDMTALFCHHLAESGGSLAGGVKVWFAALRDIARHGRGFSDRSLGAPTPPRSPRQDTSTMERMASALSHLRRDIAFALRLLRKDWAFSLSAVTILALAIGANTAIFSFIDSHVLRPLPYPEPDRLMLVTRTQRGGTGTSHDGATWLSIRDAQSDAFRAAVYSGWATEANLAVGTEASTVTLQRVGARYFETLGVLPALGRDFTPAEDVADGASVAILSHGIWLRLFAGDRDAVGESVLLRGEPHTVVGVLPADFDSSAQAEIWVPLRASTSGEGEGTNFAILARVASDASVAEAEGSLHAIAAGINDGIEDPARHLDLGLTPLQVGDSQMLRAMLALLAAAVGTVLVVACVNVSGLLLARGARRGQEIATRMAIGGGRGAILRQFVVESVVLALAGGLAGLLFARVALRLLAVAGAEVIGVWRPVGLDLRVLAGTAVISLLTALVFGIAPAFQASRVSINDALRSNGSRGVAARTRLWRKLLVVAEVALSVVLLVAAGLLMRTFLHLQSLDPGFDPEGIVSVSVSLQDARYETREDIEQLFNAGVERLREVPGVRGATAALGLPYQRLLNMGFQPMDFELAENQNAITNLVYVTPGYFETLAVSLLEGRGIDASDAHDAARVAVVNKAFADEYLDGRSPLGYTIGTAGEERRIVGLAETVRQRGSWGARAPADETPVVYVPASQLGDGFFPLVHTWFAPAWIVRVSGEPGAAIPEIERALASVDPLLPLASTRLASDLRADAIALERFTATLVGTLATVAIVLAALGIYGLVASTVADRRRDIGIRLALGAGAGHAIRVTAMPTIWLAAIGAAIGIAGSVAAARAIRSLLWGVAPSDPWTYGGVALALVLAAAIASLVPASRAARVDPVRTLRMD